MNLQLSFSYSDLNKFEELDHVSDLFDTEIKKFLLDLIDKNYLIVGERCRGTIFVTDNKVKIEYTYCSELGEDWNDDLWIDKTLTVNNTLFSE